MSRADAFDDFEHGRRVGALVGLLHRPRVAPPTGLRYVVVGECLPLHREEPRVRVETATLELRQAGARLRLAGVKIAAAEGSVFYREDVTRGQWAANDRERMIRQVAEADGVDTAIWLEQEPGSGGRSRPTPRSADWWAFPCGPSPLAAPVDCSTVGARTLPPERGQVRSSRLPARALRPSRP